MSRLTALLITLLAVSAPLLADGEDPLRPIFLDSDTEKPSEPARQENKAAPPAETAKSKPDAAIEVDEENRRVTLAGRFTGAAGAIELGTCAKAGKTYLAVVAIDARPSQVAEAMKRLGLAPGKVPVADRQQGTATPPAGPQVRLYVQWHVAVRNELLLRRARLEEFFWSRADDKVLPDSSWIYAGGESVGDEPSGSTLFSADVSGSVATINRLDTSALFYYGAELPQLQVLRANPNLRPPAGTRCRLVIEPVPEAKPAEQSPPTEVETAPKPEEDLGPAPPPGEMPAAPAETEKQPDSAPPAPAVEPPAEPAPTETPAGREPTGAPGDRPPEK